jgi:hypothetical protein
LTFEGWYNVRIRKSKNTIRRYGIEDQWFAFREKALENIVIAWLEENNISYIS